ncbi:helix-turn-helix domain-containing protein [Enterococcus faecium]|uniref:helix-turn-helix domain-containing protein n=1 Tax=Enterococcus faecium TaxID=1352 RepID=UPI000CF29D61|nr:helix-turn-helix transcriptional regulator [Enterococcus faecium]EGP4984885.1 helix-turn-helix transcriptional regulator [Enterococcus faecium]EGP5086842.1 XRE family transcriptional regulator [Enterococcus faecium]EGP5138250.1 XRE family transcriptional regulator [Enterococcus faecium]EME3545312.1 helix-turn-helix transcriptional regulator [Enterococcus faecium]EME7137638.1 helix-turn-helix transcriptional regulator [Enterococcus faecium]
MANPNFKLKQIRKEQSITQEQIANHLKVARQTVSKWESEKSIPDIDNSYQLAAFLNVDLETLLGQKQDIAEIRIINKQNRIKKALSIFLIIISLIILLFGCKFYSDENKELNLNNVTDISYLSGDGVEINTLDGEKIQVNSYFDIVRYSISHPDSKYDTKVRKTVVTKKNIEKIIQKDKEYSGK